MSKPVSKLINHVRLAGQLALALPLAGSLGCWEEIKYEPAPEVVQSAVGEKTAAPEESAGDGVATPAVAAGDTLPAEPAPAERVADESVAEPSSPPLETPPLELSDQPDAEAESTATTAAAPAATPAQRLLIWQAAGK